MYSLRHCARCAVTKGNRVRPLSTTPQRTGDTSRNFDEETDVLIIGSGAGALTASLRARKLGLRTVIIEKESTIGGASAVSGGGLWIPCNPVSAAAGIKDSKQAALRYFEQAVGDTGPASSLARRNAYVDNGPKMVQFLQQLGFQFHFSKGYPDYYPDLEGAISSGGGRTIESKVFNVKKLDKEWRAKLPPPLSPVAIYGNDAPVITRSMSSPGAFLHTVRVMLPLMVRALAGQELVSLGMGLVAQLLYLNLKHGSTDIRVNTKISRLIQGKEGGIHGAEVQSLQGDSIKKIGATKGVILAAGGFAQNKKMREQFMPSPASTTWTSSPKGDTGDAITEGIRVGADTALMDDAWWGPTIVDPVTFKNHFALSERARPHCFIVDSSGCRFMNEAQSYTDAGHDQYARNEKVSAIPAWLIMDSDYRNRYMLGKLLPRTKPSKEALSRKVMFQAESIEDLAQQIGIDPAALASTTSRYNELCRTGADTDYGKGNNAYDSFFGEPTANGPNPNMGTVDRPPYYAVAIWPGDLGTKGGLLTDEFQRVLDKESRPIPGLFAIGNTAASIMGRTYLGAGSTLGPALTHGYIVATFLGGGSL
ncbi:3-ketosteroid 1-dehydrogenase helE [Aspergillus puulaauensis]|uniref:FAD-dependent oxidoreductase 2 FAD-binding domain-containing protein n=1 Tax=Aspergillus puulaauensis TaxID=1220207 RepID=A0A7R8APS5_9EURO|nr:uncharacterized protein APUU_51467S [Aspergillus puulaauensis]BCS26756.1 hypothetical protein APUU_51467S [Aspergillus puulaauensis]